MMTVPNFKMAVVKPEVVIYRVLKQLNEISTSNSNSDRKTAFLIHKRFCLIE